MNGCSMECACHKTEQCKRFLGYNLNKPYLNRPSFPMLLGILYQPLNKNLHFPVKKPNVFTFSVQRRSSLKAFHVSAYTTVMKDKITCLHGCNHLNTSMCYSNRNPLKRQLHSHSFTSVQS